MHCWKLGSTDKADYGGLSSLLSIDYDSPIYKHAVKLSKYGRASGGIVIYIKKALSQQFHVIDEFSCGIVLELSESLFGVSCLLVICYLPPMGSSFYKNRETNGMYLLNEKLLELSISHPNHKFIVSGDLNARIKDYKDFKNIIKIMTHTNAY